MGPTQPITRSESIVNNVINFIRAISSLDRRTQFIAIAIFAGLSTVTAILWSRSKLSPADKIFKDANLISVLLQDGEKSHDLAAKIVGLSQEVLGEHYKSSAKEIEAAFSLHLNLLFFKIVKSRETGKIEDFLKKNFFAVTNDELPIRAQISAVWNKMCCIGNSNNVNYAFGERSAADPHKGLYQAYFYHSMKNGMLSRNETFREAIEIDTLSGEQNIFSWVGRPWKGVSTRAKHFSAHLLLLKHRCQLTVLDLFLFNCCEYVCELMPFDPKPHHLNNPAFLNNTLKCHPELLEKFIFTESYLQLAMPIVLNLIDARDQDTIVNVVKFLQLAKVIPIESGGYMKLVDRMKQSFDLLDTEEALKGLENLSACAKLITGTPDFLNERQKAVVQVSHKHENPDLVRIAFDLSFARNSKVENKGGFDDAKLLRNPFHQIQAKVNDLLLEYSDNLAEYSKIFGYYEDIRYAVFGITQIKEEGFEKIKEARTSTQGIGF